MRPTREQEIAATTLDRHVAVTAGPGSGKTRVLVARYLTILERRAARVENVVAITFTNKAANEMRERLQREVDQRIESSKRTSEEPFWRDVKRRLESAVITTIHGFCSRILRESPIEAVVDPQFATLDDYASAVMLDAAVQAAVTELIDREDDLGAHLVAAYGRPTLVDHLTRTYTTLRNIGVALDDAEATTLGATGDVAAFRERRAELDRRVAAARETVARDRSFARTTAPAKIAAFAVSIERTRRILEREPSLDGVAEFLAALAELRAAAPNRTIATPLKPWVEAVKEIVGEPRDPASGALFAAFFDVVSRGFTPLLFRTLRAVDGLYSAEKRAAAALDYEDLQLRARAVLRDDPEVARRVRSRYRFYLVDEFQDTNAMQREIVELLALGKPSANLFVVGDPKQSVYGFRGAEVEVFASTVRDLEARGGIAVSLATNFRSDPRLVDVVNALFTRLMRPEPGDDPSTLDTLGFVGYEAGVAFRRPVDESEPAVEILLDLPRDGDDEESDERAREREARRLAARIASLVESGEPMVLDRARDDGPRPPRYGDIALLLRAMTDSKVYERALRRAGVPFYVVAGKGFYERSETRDLLNLLTFVDNQTDERALVAVLRSPLFGISDETLLALRIEQLGMRTADRRSLLDAMRDHARNDLIANDQHAALDEAVLALEHLLSLRNRVSTSDLLLEALAVTEYESVVAASDDGAQRLTNVDKLVGVARQFERGAARLLRDFIDYVRDFRRLEGREAEASLVSREDAVAILTVHKAKGLEFPIVCIADLQRELRGADRDFDFDRALGLAFRVPDGCGGLALTSLLARVAERRRLRARFESIRLLYVAATRAQDFLLLSGATDRRVATEGRALRDLPSWLHWVVAATHADDALAFVDHALLDLGGVGVRVVGPRVPIVAACKREAAIVVDGEGAPVAIEPFEAVERARRLLGPVLPDEATTTRRFGATALQSYANCERRFYYTRMLRLSEAEATTRDASEAAEGRSRMPASLRGLVIHRFCETLEPGEDLGERLRRSLDEVRSRHGDVYADVFATLSTERAVAELLPYARNYGASRLRTRVDERLATGRRLPDGQHEFVRSELSFTTRIDEAVVFGTIDKLVITPLASGRVRVHVVDFKTARIRSGDDGLASAVERHALDYRLQMQIYAHAARRLLADVAVVEATLHFLALGPDVEYQFPPDVVSASRAEREISAIVSEINRSGYDPARFPARPGDRCLTCAHAPICAESVVAVAGEPDGDSATVMAP